MQFNHAFCYYNLSVVIVGIMSKGLPMYYNSKENLLEAVIVFGSLVIRNDILYSID